MYIVLILNLDLTTPSIIASKQINREESKPVIFQFFDLIL